MSTANKLVYLGVTKSKIKDVINMTGAGIDNNTTFRNYAQALYNGYINVLKDRNTLLDNMNIGTSTGTITDSANLPMYEDKMSKLSTQETTNGYQLFDIEDGTYTTGTSPSASITFKDGKMTNLTHNFTQSFGITISLRTPITLNANQSYTRANNSGGAYPYISLKNDTTTIDSMSASDNGVKTYTPTETKIVNNIYLWFANNLTYTQINPMMNTGSTIKTFEKYTGGIASPNPSYPQEVKTVKGYRNLFPLPTTESKNNVTFTKNTDGTFNISTNGTASADSDFKVEMPATFLTSGNYTITSKSTGYQIHISYYNGSSWVSTAIYKGDSISTRTQTVTVPNNATKLIFMIRVLSGASVNLTNETIMLNKGDIQLPYIPYGTNWIYTTISDGTNTKNIPLPLNNNEIAGIGTYLDELIVDKNGHCWLNKKTGKVVLNGSEDENWSNTGYSFQTENYKSAINLGLSNYFTYSTTWLSSDVLYRGKFNFTSSRLRFMHNDANITTTEQWKTWLSTHNTEVYYVLAEEQLIDLNYNVDLTLYEGTNNITNSENMDMAIKYVKNVYE